MNRIQLPPGLTRAQVGELLTLDGVRSSIADEFSHGHMGRHGGLTYRLTLSGEPGYTIESTHYLGWGLPWTVESRGRSWVTCDPRLSRLISGLGDPENACDGSKQWPTVWADNWFWEIDVLQPLVEKDRGQRLYRTLPGYSELATEFAVLEAEADPYARENYLLATLRPRSGWLDEVRVALDDVSTGWEPTLHSYQRSMEMLKPYRWVREWKAAGSGRSCQLWIGYYDEKQRVSLRLQLDQDSVDLRLGSDALEVWHKRSWPGKLHWFDREVVDANGDSLWITADGEIRRPAPVPSPSPYCDLAGYRRVRPRPAAADPRK